VLPTGAAGAAQSLPAVDARGTSAAVTSAAQQSSETAQSSGSDRPQPPAPVGASTDAGHLAAALPAADCRRKGTLAPTDGCSDTPIAAGSGTMQPGPVPAPERGRSQGSQTADGRPAAAVLDEVRKHATQRLQQ